MNNVRETIKNTAEVGTSTEFLTIGHGWSSCEQSQVFCKWFCC